MSQITKWHCDELARRVQERIVPGTIHATMADKHRSVCVTWSHGYLEMSLMVTYEELTQWSQVDAVVGYLANRFQAAIEKNSELIEEIGNAQ